MQNFTPVDRVEDLKISLQQYKFSFNYKYRFYIITKIDTIMKTININTAKNILAWVIASALTLLFLQSAYGKFANPEMMDMMKLTDFAVIIPIGEIVAALLFLFPKTNIFGGVLLSAYMGGAIIIHMTSGMSIFLPSAVLIMIWVVGILRNPDLLKLR